MLYKLFLIDILEEEAIQSIKEDRAVGQTSYFGTDDIKKEFFVADIPYGMGSHGALNLLVIRYDRQLLGLEYGVSSEENFLKEEICFAGDSEDINNWYFEFKPAEQVETITYTLSYE